MAETQGPYDPRYRSDRRESNDVKTWIALAIFGVIVVAAIVLGF